MPESFSQAPDRDTNRVEAFSDGVFAIAITLLVLDLKVSRDLTADSLRTALLARWLSYVSFLASFAVIGIMWLNHHRMFRVIRHASHGVLLLNGLLLLMVTVVPFPTALVSEYLGHEGGALAAAVYCGWFVATSLVWNALWRFAASPSRQPPVLAISLDDPAVRKMSRAFLMGPVVYTLAFVLSFWYPAIAVALCGAVAVGFSLAPNQ
jgi:uncharacterized membrane protein